MIIGVPRERKTLEKRVALTPDGANKLVQHGHEVLIEKDAGAGSHFPDKLYEEVGCRLVPTLKDVWTNAELVIKVKEPHESEFEYFRPGLALFDYLHLASMPDVTQALLKGGVTGIAYELVADDHHGLPLLNPMSEIAGKLSVLNGSYFLLSQNGGRGVLLGGALGVEPANVVILGAGIAGRAAAEMAFGMGARVTILDINVEKLEYIKTQLGNQVTALYSTPASLARAAKSADLLIGAVLIPGAAAPKLVTKSIVDSMREGAVFVDISIDQGGCAETIRATSLDDPVYAELGVLHYGVCNMPAQVARTSTMALTSATLPYILRLADEGVENLLRNDEIMCGALNTYGGKLTNEAVSEAVGIEFTPAKTALQQQSLGV